jgi:hypothetical protein
MHPDMQTFLDVLDINPTLDVSITVKVHGYIVGYVEFNGQRCSEGSNHFQIALLDSLSLVSNITKYVEGTSAVEITELTVNGYNVIPKYQHHSSSGNAYHDWIGVWQMEISNPFYVWYHTVSGQGWIA